MHQCHFTIKAVIFGSSLANMKMWMSHIHDIWSEL